MSKKAFFKNLENYSKCKIFARFSAIPIPNSRHIHLFFNISELNGILMIFFSKLLIDEEDGQILIGTIGTPFTTRIGIRSQSFLKKNAFTFFSHNEMLLSKKGKKVHYFLYFRANKILMISVTRQLTYSICHCLLFCQFLKCLI